MTKDKRIERRRRMRSTDAHVFPFLTWIGVMFLLGQVGEDAAWKYAARSAATLVVFWLLRPWRYYAPPVWRYVPLACGVGLGVFVLWILPETSWVQTHWPAVTALYRTWFVFPLGRIPEPVTASVYDPAVCGWKLSAVRVLGSALVIGVVEEFFWRGFLFRWLGLPSREVVFVDVDPRVAARPLIVILACVAFAAEHLEWAAALMAGAAYLWLYIRTRDLWTAAIAHAVTNAALGVYVIWAKAWWYW